MPPTKDGMGRKSSDNSDSIPQGVKWHELQFNFRFIVTGSRVSVVAIPFVLLHPQSRVQ